MKVFFSYFYKHIFFFFLCIGISIASLVVDYSDLPRGFEIAKVKFIIFSTPLLLSVFLFYNDSPRLKITKSKAFYFASIFVSVLISSLISNYLSVSIIGNHFRYQGFLFYISILVISIIFYKIVNKKNFLIFALMLFITSVIHSIVGISQLYYLLEVNPLLIEKGLYINGNYGQSNFFSTHLIIGIISGIYLLQKISLSKTRFKVILTVSTVIFLILILINLIFSYSIFGWIIGVLSIVLSILYFLLKNQNRKLLYFYIIIFLLLSLLTFIISVSDFDNFRLLIWNESLTILFSADIKNILFGFGFDSVGYIFQDNNVFPEVFIDRGHNLIVDLLLQIGLIGTIIVILPLLKILKRHKHIFTDPEIFFSFLLFVLVFAKFQIHEYSAIGFLMLSLLIVSTYKFLHLEEI